MPAKAGQIVIDITAGTSKFVTDMDKATAKIHEFGAAGVSETKATRAAFKVLEGDIANNTRAAEQFAEKFLGIGKLAAVAFPAIGAAALIGTLVEGGRKIKDFFDGVFELPGKIAGAFRAIASPLQTTNDELQVSNDRLANDIAKLEGKPVNNLKLMLDQAVESADKLANSMDKVLGEIAKIVKADDVSFWQKWFGNTAASPDLKARFGEDGGFSTEINKITDAGTEALRRATTAKEKDATQQKLSNDLLAAYRAEIFETNKILSETEEKQKTHDRNPLAQRDQSARIAELQGIIRQLRLEESGIALQDTNTRLTGTKDGLSAGAEDRKQDEEKLTRLGRELAEAKAAQADAMDRITIKENEELNNLDSSSPLYEKQLAAIKEIYDTQRGTEQQKLADQYAKTLEELTKRYKSAAELAKGFAETFGVNEKVQAGIKQLEDGAKAVTKWAEQYNKLTAARDAESLRHAVSMAGAGGNPNDPLGTLANQQAIERLDIETRYEEKLKNSADDRERSIALGEKELALQKLQDQMEEQIAEHRHKNMADFFRDMQGQSKDLGDILYEGAHSALDKISDDFAKLVEHPKKTNISQLFGDSLKSIGGDMTKSAIKSIMQQGLGKLGKLFGVKPKEGKPDGSDPNPFYVIVKNFKDQLKREGDPLKDIAVPALPPALSGSGGAAVGTALNGIGAFIGKLFGGGSRGMSTSSITYMADGGDMAPGRVYGVAEAGEAELVSPKNSSRITPLSKLGGGDSHVYHIDARGADLGARNRVARAIEASHAAAVQDSVRANKEHARRVPRSRR